MGGQVPSQVRYATLHDDAAVAQQLGDAFRDNPVLSRLFHDPNGLPDMVAGYLRAAVKHLYVPHQRICIRKWE